MKLFSSTIDNWSV